jgi:hypothetical protein
MVKYFVGVIMGTMVVACSSVPPLPLQTNNLSTQALGEQYYFCESCNIPTELSTQSYKPLEPDTVIVPIIKPIMPTYTANNLQDHKKRSHKTKIKKHKQRTLKKFTIKQCIEWSK